MNRRSMLTILTAAGLIGYWAVPAARADEMVKFREIMHVTFLQTQDVGDVDGHTASLFRFSGIASFPDGTVGAAYYVGTNDSVKGVGTFSSYNNLTFNDGSVLWYRGTGTATVDGTTSVFEGTVSVLGGKGRFEGAKGDGTVTGTRLAPVAVGGDSYFDLVINVRK